jgi:hypothetical protein
MAPEDPGPPPPDPSTWTLPRLRITRDGDWLHDDEDVTHAGILRNLRENLRVDAAGHYLQIGPARVPVEVDDAPYLVLRVEPEGEQLILTLNDFSREPLAIETLSFDERAVPHCRVKGGRFLARLSRAATYQLLDRVEADEFGECATLRVGDVRRSLRLPSDRPSERPAP